MVVAQNCSENPKQVPGLEQRYFSTLVSCHVAPARFEVGPSQIGRAFSLLHPKISLAQRM
jgi:hypothetical protein